MQPHSTVLLALAWFGLVNAALSLLSWAVAPALLSRTRRGDVLLLTRLFAAGGSTLFALAVFLPAHWRFEPGNATDSFGLSMYLLAGIAIALLLRAGYRAALVAVAARALRAIVRPSGQTALAARELAGFNGVSLAGVLRTHILVGPAARKALSPEELEVSLAHEVAHRSAYDNLKRVALYCAPDLLTSSRAARALEHGWHVSAETLADARAVRGDRVRAANLAAALIKVARLETGGPSPVETPAWSTLHDPPLLETRVRRLLEGQPPSAGSSCSPAVVITLFACTVAALAFTGASSPAVHDATEWLVRILP